MSAARQKRWRNALYVSHTGRCPWRSGKASARTVENRRLGVHTPMEAYALRSAA